MALCLPLPDPLGMQQTGCQRAHVAEGSPSPLSPVQWLLTCRPCSSLAVGSRAAAGVGSTEPLVPGVV